jgi:CBS domain containing-hemolysin-like protein
MAPTPLVLHAGTSVSSLERLGELQPAALAAGGAALFAAWFFACLRLCLRQAIAARVLERAKGERHRTRLEGLIDKLSALSESANLFESACGILFALIVLLVVSEGRSLDWRAIVVALCVSVPPLWVATRGLAQAVALRYGDAWVARMLPAFYVAQLPLWWLVYVFAALRRGLMRALGLPDDEEQKREIVAGLREVIADAEVSGKLDETEREIIGNVMEFRDVDAAAVMTPRTEICAVDVHESVREAARIATESGHSRIPIYENTIDSVIGTVSVKDLLRALGSADDANGELRALVHPAYFVPETKQISELLAEFRREKLGLAVVLDEYGGTAGLVTSTDILSEIVGDLPAEGADDEELPVRFLPGGVAEVDASTHVSEVNKVLDLEIPETADYQTLGGYVLAELGRFPERGERFVRNDSEFRVTEASDRRVLTVRIKKLAAAAQ